MLLGDELLSGADVVGEARDTGDVFIGMITINECTRADFEAVYCRLRATDNVLHFSLEIAELVAHGTGGIKDEEYVSHFGGCTWTG